MLFFFLRPVDHSLVRQRICRQLQTCNVRADEITTWMADSEMSWTRVQAALRHSSLDDPTAAIQWDSGPALCDVLEQVVYKYAEKKKTKGGTTMVVCVSVSTLFPFLTLCVLIRRTPVFLLLAAKGGGGVCWYRPRRRAWLRRRRIRWPGVGSTPQRPECPVCGQGAGSADPSCG